MKSKDRRHHAFAVNSSHAVDSAASEAVRLAVSFLSLVNYFHQSGSHYVRANPGYKFIIRI